MTTLFTSLPIFTKPGPMRSLLEERGLKSEWTGAVDRAGGNPGQSEVIQGIMARAGEMEYFLADTAPLDKAFFQAAKKLKLVSMFGVGLDHIDIASATEHGVLVANVPGGNARCVAELALAFMLNLAHRVVEMHMGLAGGVWRPRLGSELHGKVLGIVGLGHIGQDTARLGAALGMKTIAANRTPKPELARALGITQMSLDEVLREADFLSLHIPGGPGSWRFGAEQFAKMKNTAFIINTARGDLVDLDALAEAVAEGRLAGAGLDVFPQEPMNMSHPVFSLSQVVVSPHAGAMSREAMVRVCSSCLDEVVRIVEKKRSPNGKNPEVYSMPGWEGF